MKETLIPSLLSSHPLCKPLQLVLQSVDPPTLQKHAEASAGHSALQRLPFEGTSGFIGPV